jgi:uncharacterized protein (TIGR02231 family)
MTRLLLLLLPFAGIHAANATERPVPSKITEVRIFLAGAQITRTATTTIPAGTSTIVFPGLAQHLDPATMQAGGKGAFTILGVQHRIDHLNESPANKVMEDLQGQIEQLEKELARENSTKQVWEQEEQLLLKNTAIGGQQHGVTAAQLQAVNDYVRERLRAVKAGWLVQQEKIDALNKRLEKLRHQAMEIRGQRGRPTSEIVVEVSSTAETSATFTLAYFVQAAGWTPSYDLRATSVGKPMELLMKAAIVNNTGEDWNKVKVGLSSGNPTLGGSMPPLRPWILQAHRPHRQHAAARPSTAESGRVMNEKYEEMDLTIGLAVEHRATTMEFPIGPFLTIPGDGRPHLTGLHTHEIAATYRHYVTPRLDRDAFLHARTTGWEELDLMPGEANIFFEGTFVGRTQLRPDVPTDTLEFSLGRDKGIVVERVKRKGTNERSLLGGHRTITTGWDITVRNTKGIPVELQVRDQYPISAVGEIQVKLDDAGGATVDEQQGMLTWDLLLAPRASEKMGFSYSVRHPRDMPLAME